jgi:serine/threonine protein kinase
MLGTTLADRYRLDAVLGMGGFGAVYRAKHLQLDHDVAIKLLHANADAGAAKRLAREAKTLARLDHPHCVRVLDFGSHEGAPFLVMELITGRSLAAALGERWSLRRVVELLLELAAGLAHAHALGLVHRDLKPSNVLLADAPGGGFVVKLIDFGIVAVAAGEQLGSFTEQLTATGKIIGTPRYMSPEQLLGAKLDARSDLYALGLIAYELLAGQPAFEASEPRRLAWLHAVAPPPPLPDGVPDELARVVTALLAKTPERRPATAEQVRERLLVLRDELPTDEGVALDLPARVDVEASTTTGAANPNEPSGTRIAHHRLLTELGRGGMGVVWLARDEALDRMVAVKLLHASTSLQRARERLLREARGLARVVHPNVVQVYEVGSHRGSLYVAMQYVPGQTLRAWLRERRPSASETLALLVDIARGLAAIHAAGLVHRDVKPDNVMVGDDGRARVLDFGLVRSVSPGLDMLDRLVPQGSSGDADPLAAKLTRTGAIIGTPAYMALEQLAGDVVDARSDQFGFCVLAFEALHGERPFAGDDLDTLAANLTAGRIHTPKRRELARVDEVLARGLRVLPSSRWPSMDALADALDLARAPRARVPRRAWLGLAGASLFVLGWLLGRVGASTPAPNIPPAETAATSARELELEQALAASSLALARVQPEAPASRRDVVTLAMQSRDHPPSPELRAALHAIADTVHEQTSLAELGRVGVLAWSPHASEPLLVLAGSDANAIVWSPSSRARVRTLDHAEPLAELRFSDDAALLVARDRSGSAVLWHVATGERLATIPGTHAVAFVAGTRELLVADSEGVSRWALVRGRELERAELVLAATEVLALASTHAQSLALAARGELHGWTPSGARTQVRLDGFAGVEGRVMMSPQARFVARTSEQGLALWASMDGQRLAVPAGEVEALAFSPDDRRLVLALRDRAPLLLELDAPNDAPRELALAPGTRALAFDADGERVLVLHEAGMIAGIELEHGQVVERLHVGPASELVLDPSGGAVALRDAASLVGVYARHTLARRVELGPHEPGEPTIAAPTWPREQVELLAELCRELGPRELDIERACVTTIR